MCARCDRGGPAICWPQMLPRMLAALARQSQPDTVLNRFDAFLARQPAGVQLLSLFQRNPGLLDRIAAVLGAAPSLADHLSNHPAAFDGLLSPEENPRSCPTCCALRLKDARLLEDAIEIIRRTVREEDFTVSVGTMEGRLDADAAGTASHDHRRCRASPPCCRACLPTSRPLRPVRGGVDGGGGDGQGGRAGDDGGLRPRSDAGLRSSGGVTEGSEGGPAIASASPSGSCALRTPMSRR